MALLAAVGCGESFTAVDSDGPSGGRASDDASGGRSFGSNGGRNFGGNGGRNSGSGGREAVGGSVDPSGGQSTSNGGGDVQGAGGSGDGGGPVEGSGGEGGSDAIIFEDDFSAPLDGRWIGNDYFSVADEAVVCEACVHPILSVTRLTMPFEVSVDFISFPEDAQEVNVVVLAQGTNADEAGCELLEISYSAAERSLHLHACLVGWLDNVAEALPLEIQPGERLELYVYSSAEQEVTVHVSLGGEEVGQWTIEYPYPEGSVGLSGISEYGLSFDNIFAKTH